MKITNIILKFICFILWTVLGIYKLNAGEQVFGILALVIAVLDLVAGVIRLMEYCKENL